MASFTDLFGSELLDKSGKVSTDSALAGKHVLLYFSAHWCPPCRGFTPKLAEFHKKFADAKGFQTVFVSGDKDQGQFDSYFEEMPWLALPFENRAAKAALNKRFKVEGIPALMILAPNGDLINKDGRSKVMGDFETCAAFPWKPPTFAEAIGDTFVKKDGSSVGKEAIAGKTLGLYFSAHWCPPCRGFTPKLKDFYTALKAKDPNFEIIFVSSDKNEDEGMDYFKNDHGDYIMLPYSKRKEKGDLSDMFKVQGIPALVVLDKDGSILNINARGKVDGGVGAIIEGGWEPPVIGNLAQSPEAAGTDINETPTVVVMCDKCSPEQQKAYEKGLESLAKSYVDRAKKTGNDIEIIFLMVTKQESGGQLKALTTKDAGEKATACGDQPHMFLFDIPDNGGFYFSDLEPTLANVETFIQDKGINFPRLQLQR